MEFDLLSGNPWSPVVNSDITNYYSCLFNIVQPESPEKILEIGTAFGMSTATLLKAASKIELFITLDLGIYGEQYDFDQNNIDYARSHIYAWCTSHRVPIDRVKFFQTNTQPAGSGDNNDAGSDIIRWNELPELVRILKQNNFDVIFVDGKHTGDGLFNDLVSFWPFLKEGGLIICDDLHNEKTYKEIFPWVGYTLRSFNKFIQLHRNEIKESYIWNYPQVIPDGYLGLRPFGLIRKKV